MLDCGIMCWEKERIAQYEVLAKSTAVKDYI